MMDGRRARRIRLANAMALAATASQLIALVLIALSPAGRVAEVASIGLAEAVALVVSWTAFSIVGAIIVRHRSDNAVGWLCCTAGLLVALLALTVGVTTYDLAGSQPSRIGVAGAWIAHTGSVAIVVAPLLILFRFPTSRALGPWWRRAEALTVAVVGTLLLMIAIEPMPLMTFPGTPNPMAIGDTSRLSALGFAPAIACAGLAVASLVVRFRQGSPLERRQLRLLAAASVLVGVALATMPITSPTLVSGGHLSTLTALINATAFAAIPVAIGIAIVRDRLYDIDRIVNRTIVYALVSAVLVGTYAMTVLGLSALLSELAPGTRNTLATAGSTLLVATLFRPIRTRAQVAVDRRFDRERYEATRMVESFAGQIRSEVELDAIIGDLRVAAATTVRPTTMDCWIRGTGR